MRKTVLITGATGSLGRALALTFAGKGWRVFAASRDAAKVEALVKGVEGLEGLTADVRREEDVRAMVAAVAARAGRLDGLVNNAAALWFEPVEATSTVHFADTLLTNVLGTFLCCREALPLLRGSGGTVVNISSVAGTAGLPGLSAYCASKFAVQGFTEAFAEEARAQGVKVLVVNPGVIRGGLSHALPPFYRPAEERDALAPEDVAGEVYRIVTAPGDLWLTKAGMRSFPAGW